MKAIIFLLTLLAIVFIPTEARFVTKASRNLMRHNRRKLEKVYGNGLVGLIDPITG
jgi:hypothetical protein